MALTDYEELAARSFEEHHDPELRAAVQVCADALGQMDDPRGPLISYEYALYDAAPKRALELRRAMHAHAAEHAVALLGGAAILLKSPRAFACEWRSGMLFGIYIDARYMPKKAKMSAGDLVRIVLRGPAAKLLRRLRVRVRTIDDITSIRNMLGGHTRPLPLEEIEVGMQVWPQRINSASVPGYGAILDKYPNLYYLAMQDAIIPLGPSLVPKLAIADVLMADAPTNVESRRLVGRALCSWDETLRDAALQRIAVFGPKARVFARVLGVLLQPRVTMPQLPIIAALRALGPSREHSLLLAKISSRTGQYDVDVRKAAGAAAAAIRPPTS